MKVIHLIAAARPNFMKIAPLWHEMKSRIGFRVVLIHTGQHHDENMSGAFFRELNLPDPDIHLGVSGGTHAEFTAEVMVRYERICLNDRPDVSIVVGDVNSTMACAIAAKKLNIPVAHLEAGLRSGNMQMPEEINRIITDRISDILWTPSEDADENLRREGVSEHSIRFVGNIMIDSYELLRPHIERCSVTQHPTVDRGSYCVATFHRPSNVDNKPALEKILDLLTSIAEQEKVYFPVHPRTQTKLRQFELLNKVNGHSNIELLPPLSYIAFMSLVINAGYVLTDSGGIQEETSYLGIPCFTLREETERPVTIMRGSNQLVSPENALAAIAQKRKLSFRREKTAIPYWDGKTAARVADDISRFFEAR